MKYLAGLLAAMILAVTGATAFAQSEPPPLSAYGELPEFEDATLSPSGKRYAMIVRLKGERTLIIVENGKAVRASTIGQLKVRSIQWVDEDHVLFVTSATEDLGIGFTTTQAEFYSAHVFSALSDEPVKTVFARQRGIITAVFGSYGVRTIDGRRIAYFGGIELEAYSPTGHRSTQYRFVHNRPALFAVDLNDMSVDKVAPSADEGDWQDWLIDTKGAVAVRLKLTTNSGKWQITNAKGTTLAEGASLTGDVSLLSLGVDGRTAIYSQQVPDSGDSLWYEVPLDASAGPSEFLPGTSAERIYSDPDTGNYIGYRDEANNRVMVDPVASKRLAMVRKAFPDMHTIFEDWTNDFGTMLVRVDGNGDSGTWYRVDLAAKSADAIGYERTQIPPDAVGPISTFAYKASDGLDLDGILTLPPGREAKDLPVVMLPHGGPHSHDVEGFDWWAQAFASRGYAVFQPNFRGSTNRDDAFMRAGYGQWGRKMQTDISDGLAALTAVGIVDPARACIVGASYGGYAALAGVTIEQGKYQCAVAVAPVSDLALMTRLRLRAVNGSRHGMRGRVLEEMLGPRSGYSEVSPFKHADRADAPILLIHGRDDTVVPYVHSQKMVDALKDAGKPYEFVELKDEDHWLSKGETRLRMLEAAVTFVQHYNPAD